jgi:hypothetical protein
LGLAPGSRIAAMHYLDHTQIAAAVPILSTLVIETA